MTAITNQTIAERASYDIGVLPQDVGTSDVTGSWFSMESFGRVAAAGISDEVTADDTFTVQLRKATDSSGTGATNLGTAVTATAGGAEALQALAEAKATDLGTDGSGNQFTHVAVQLSASAGGTVGSAVLIRADGAYRP